MIPRQNSGENRSLGSYSPGCWAWKQAGPETGDRLEMKVEPGSQLHQIPPVQQLRALLSMKVLSEMLASSKELELLCPGEALDKANTLPGTLTAENKSENWRASCQPEQVKHQAGGLQNSKTQEYQKRGLFCVSFKSQANVCCIPGGCDSKTLGGKVHTRGPGTRPPEF